MRRLSTSLLRVVAPLSSSPAERYRRALGAGSLHADDMQAAVVLRLEAMHVSLLNGEQPRGLYLFGGPGLGKTLLANLLQDAPGVRRAHFHELMQLVHRSLHELRASVDPLAATAERLAEGTHLLFLDELEVTDVADACLLLRLHAQLQLRGVALLATSNAAPERLYAGGLNAALFQPAFARAVRASCDVLDLDRPSSADYRASEAATPFYLRSGAAAEARLDAAWAAMLARTGAAPHAGEQVAVAGAGRAAFVPASAGGAARFTFAQLCGCGQDTGAKSAADYSALLRRFDALLISDVPAASLWGGAGDGDDELRRFVNFVDLAYERRALLFLSVDAPLPNQLDAAAAALPPVSLEVGLFVTGEGGSSGRSTTMMAPGVEWSATGRQGASLAALTNRSFARSALPRCASRLRQMMAAAWARGPGPVRSAEALALADALARVTPPT